MAQFTPHQIARWLRAYGDWCAELEVEVSSAGSASATDGSQVRSTRRSDPTARAAQRDTELAERCRIIDGWLNLLTPLERVAARCWVSEEFTVGHAAADMGVEYRRAQNLVRAIPLLVWGHLYNPPVDVNAESS